MTHNDIHHRLKVNGVVKDVHFPLSTGLKDRNGIEIFEGDVIDIDTDAALKFYVDTHGDYQVQKSLFGDEDTRYKKLPPSLEFIEHCRDLKSWDKFIYGKIIVKYNLGGFFLAVEAPNAAGWLAHLSEVADFATHAFSVINS